MQQNRDENFDVPAKQLWSLHQYLPSHFAVRNDEYTFPKHSCTNKLAILMPIRLQRREELMRQKIEQCSNQRMLNHLTLTTSFASIKNGEGDLLENFDLT